MSRAVFCVAREFSRTPAGRLPADGPFCAQALRDEFLLPLLARHEQVEVDFTGVLGLSSAFLEEAFAGLVRTGAHSAQSLHRKLRITSPVRTWQAAIWRHIDAAAAATSHPPGPSF